MTLFYLIKLCYSDRIGYVVNCQKLIKEEKKNEKDKRQSNIKIAKNEGIIDIRMSKSGEEVA